MQELLFSSCNSLVGVATSIRTGRPRNLSYVPGRGKIYGLQGVQAGTEVHTGSYPMGTCAVSARRKLYLVPRSRTRGAILPLCHTLHGVVFN